VAAYGEACDNRLNWGGWSAVGLIRFGKEWNKKLYATRATPSDIRCAIW
jgi:hypothetical protein